MLKIPSGYTIHAYATYDNTSSNPTNPNSPPQNMFWCDYTSCEMFFLPFSYVPYEEGDEDIFLGNYEDSVGCTDSNACNYAPEAIIDDGSCGVLDDCGECFFPCCFNTNTNTCDYTVGEQDCEYFWAGFDVVSDPEQNIFWNTSCESGCTDPEACNYDDSIIPGGFDDGSCEYPDEYYDCEGNCLNDVDQDGICDEAECFTVLCTEWAECVLGDCVCINDINANGICDEDEQEDCSNLDILSVYQDSDTQFVVNVYNSSWSSAFSYPGFILFNSFGDTIAVENVNFFVITEESQHLLEIQENAVITPDVSLQLYTGFYDFLQCQWDDLVIVDNCELDPDPGNCFAAIAVFYYNQETGMCEETMWGGCGGVVPFWTLEDCQNACGSDVYLDDYFMINKKPLVTIDVLGRAMFGQKDFVITIYEDGSIDKKFILQE